MKRRVGTRPGGTRLVPTRPVGALPLLTLPILVLPILTLTGCAGSTLGSGVGDAWLEQSPWYAEAPVSAVARGDAPAGAAAGGRTVDEGADVLYLPILAQPDPDVAPRFDGPAAASSSLARLVAEMNDHLDTVATTRGWRRAPGSIGGSAPDVQLGCEADVTGECVIDENELGEAVWDDRLRLAVTRGSAEWREAAVELLAREGATTLVLITLETGWYWPRQTNWRGSKIVDLGTDRVQELSWLTALDRPIQVLQVTGVAIGPDGRAQRIGGEGLLARRTPIVLSGFGIDALVSDEDVERLLLQPADPPGNDPPQADRPQADRPQADRPHEGWRHALTVLAERLTGGGQPAARSRS